MVNELAVEAHAKLDRVKAFAELLQQITSGKDFGTDTFGLVIFLADELDTALQDLETAMDRACICEAVRRLGASGDEQQPA